MMIAVITEAVRDGVYKVVLTECCGKTVYKEWNAQIRKKVKEGLDIRGYRDGEITVHGSLREYFELLLMQYSMFGTDDAVQLEIVQQDKYECYLQATLNGANINLAETDTVNIPDGVQTIRREGWNAAKCMNVQHLVLPGSVDTFCGFSLIFPNLQTVTIGQGISRIPSDIFRDLPLTEIVVPEGVKEIGTMTFANCAKLQSVSLPRTLKKICARAFTGCAALQELVLPANLKEIERSAFDKAGITSLILPKELSTLGNYCFSQSALTFVEIHCEQITAGSLAFQGCDVREIVLADSVKLLPKSMFSNCEKLERIVLSKSLRHLQDNLFQHCKSLVDIQIPDNIKNIHTEAFFGCTSLTDLYIPDSVAVIGDSAWRNCSALKHVRLPRGLKEMGQDVFRYCRALQDVELPPDLQVLPKKTFNGCDVLQTVQLPDSLQKICEGCFSWSGITDIEIPVDCALESEVFSNSKLRHITFKGAYTKSVCLMSCMFSHCELLEEITLPEGIVTISDSCFTGCRSLRRVILPESLVNLSPRCFAACFELEELYLPKGLRVAQSVLGRETCPKLVITAHKDSPYIRVLEEMVAVGQIKGINLID